MMTIKVTFWSASSSWLSLVDSSLGHAALETPSGSLHLNTATIRDAIAKPDGGAYVSFFPGGNCIGECSVKIPHFHTSRVDDVLMQDKYAKPATSYYLRLNIDKIHRAIEEFVNSPFKWSARGSMSLRRTHEHNCGSLVRALLVAGGIREFVSVNSVPTYFPRSISGFFGSVALAVTPVIIWHYIARSYLIPTTKPFEDLFKTTLAHVPVSSALARTRDFISFAACAKVKYHQDDPAEKDAAEKIAHHNHAIKKIVEQVNEKEWKEISNSVDAAYASYSRVMAISYVGAFVLGGFLAVSFKSIMLDTITPGDVENLAYFAFEAQRHLRRKARMVELARARKVTWNERLALRGLLNIKDLL